MGDTILGRLTARREKNGRYKSATYTLENAAGVHVVFGTTVLEDRMRTVMPGDLVKIVFKGVKENEKGNATKLFEVFKKPGKRERET